MKEKIKEVLKKRNILDFVIILLISCIICFPLLKNNQDVYFDDGIQHISRAYGTLESIKNGNFNIITSFTNNFGYSWNLFYGPLTTYMIIIVELLVKNFIIAYKITVFVLLLLSGITMYKLLYQMTGNRNIALLSSGIYMLSPYHLTDLYTRNALGEFASFVFIPLVFLGLYNIFNTSDNNYYLAIGAIGLILSHNISTLITAIFAVVYVFINIKELKNTKILKKLFVNFVFIIFITSFFWIPMLQTKYSANYSVYEQGYMATSETTAANGIIIRDFFVTFSNEYFNFEIGPCLILLAFSVMTLRSLENNRKEYFLSLTFAVLSLFMATKYFPWKYLPDKISIIQFPWRMLEFSTFFLSIVCSINAYVIIKKFNIVDVLIMLVILTIYNRPVVLYQYEPIQNIENIGQGIVSGSQHEVIAGMGKSEYLTVNANKDRFYLATREDKVYVLSGKTIIEEENKTDKKLTFKVDNKELTEYEAPYIYYPGYEITIDGIEIENFETENGFLGFRIEENTKGKVEIVYQGTKLMKISYVISTVSLLGFGIYIWKKH